MVGTVAGRVINMHVVILLTTSLRYTNTYSPICPPTILRHGVDLFSNILGLRKLSTTMADPIQSFLSDHEQSEAHHIPERSHAICCCGNDACAYLRHNQSALEELEKDVSTAARLGKVCNFHSGYASHRGRVRPCAAVRMRFYVTRMCSQDVAAFGKVG